MEKPTLVRAGLACLFLGACLGSGDGSGEDGDDSDDGGEGGSAAFSGSGGATSGAAGSGGSMQPMGCGACGDDQVCLDGECADLPDMCPCPPGSYCNLADNRCAVGCVSAEHCATGWSCDTSARRCVCQEDAVCGSGSVCEGSSCVPGCRNDSACPNGQICLNLTCGVGCREDTECGAGMICEGFACVAGCRADTDCAAAEICEDLSCRTGCRMDAECGSGRICEDLSCRDGCRTDPACGTGRICEGLLCRDGCRAPEHCPLGQTCLNLACIPGCRTPADCGVTGATCTNGICGCPSGLESCAGQCVDLQSSNRHCGRCNNDCGPGACQAGDCMCSTFAVCGDGCSLGEGETCNDSAQCCEADGYACINLSCTQGCRTPADCDLTGAVCTNGQCLCGPGLTECDGECVNVTSDERHCGVCNFPCAGTCASGACF